MGFDRVAAVFAATVSHFSTSSSSGSSVSSSPLPPLGSPFSSAWAGYGRTGGLRLSSSLQDFSTYRKVSAEETDLSLGVGAGVPRTKASSLQREGILGGSSFSKEKVLPSTSLRSRRWVKAAVGFSLFVMLFTLITLGFGWLRPYWRIEASHFSIVLDCGSTGTRIHVYEWVQNDGKSHENLPMVLHTFPQLTDSRTGQQNGRAYHRMETEPGFDKLLHNESGLRAAIEPLLQWAEKKIPVHAHRNSPLFLLATAGLRRLPTSDSEWILDKAWSILEESSFMCRRSWVKIITGVEEAYYGWVALNYNMNRLGNFPMQETFGALDLGGSSLQVTFESGESTQSEYGLNLSIGEMEHHLNAYSLAGYGLNDAFEKSVFLLLRKFSNSHSRKLSDGQLQLNHPCLHTGYTKKYSCFQCSSLQQDGSPLVSGKDMSKKGSHVVIELIGRPNWEECEALAKSTVNASERLQSVPGIDCKKYPCALSNHQPQPRGKFYAMSGFFVVYKFFNLSSDATLDDILEKGRMFCMKTWRDAEQSVVPQPSIEQYCFRAPYVVSLLRDGLHLKDEQVVVGSGSITWTLGAALLEAGALFSGKMRMRSQARLDMFRKGNLYLDPTTLTAVLFVFLIIIIFAVSCIRKWILRLWRKPHLPLFGHHTSNGSPIPKLPSPFRFQGRSPGNGVSAGRSGDGKIKIPLSPSTTSFQQPFGLGQTLASGSVQHVDPGMHQSPISTGLSFSNSNLCQIQNDTGTMWTPHRGQTRLQSRRSQSREDLSSSVLESHVVKL